MIPDIWRMGEIAVLGLGKSGTAVATLLAREGASVYASDAAAGPGCEINAGILRPLGVHVDVGTHDLERITRASLVVASPGIPPDAPPLAAAREAGLPIVGDIEVALHVIPGLAYVAVTGTNGKTTTTALIAHLLRALGLDAMAAGNIGVPLAEVALREQRPAWVALEVSSFQLHDTPSIDPTVGVITNLTPDHLDRYESVDAYFADKALLLRNASERSRWVLNGDDPEIPTLAARRPESVQRRDELRGDLFRFSLADSTAEAWFDRAGAAASRRSQRRERAVRGARRARRRSSAPVA
jgi:UDP-N-acetylmuramoylalanine--D-glutamate ligase